MALLLSLSGPLVLKVQDLFSACAAGLGKLRDPQHHQQSLFSRAQVRALLGLALAPLECGTAPPMRKSLYQALASPQARAQVDRYSPTFFSKSEVVALGAFFSPSPPSSHKLKGCPWYCSSFVKSKVKKQWFTIGFQKPSWLALSQCRGFSCPVAPAMGTCILGATNPPGSVRPIHFGQTMFFSNTKFPNFSKSTHCT